MLPIFIIEGIDMKLYHYAPKRNTVLTKGLYSISKWPHNLRAYAGRAGCGNQKGILEWLDQTFAGRSRAVSCLTEPIQWQGNDPVLKQIVSTSTLFSFELNDLINAGIVEAIWCKNGSDADGYNEILYQVAAEEIDTSPLAWEKCDSSQGLLYGAIRHYFVVLKRGRIPAKYLKEEKI